MNFKFIIMIIGFAVKIIMATIMMEDFKVQQPQDFGSNIKN